MEIDDLLRLIRKRRSIRTDEEIKEYIRLLRQRTKHGYDAGFWAQKGDSSDESV